MFEKQAGGLETTITNFSTLVKRTRKFYVEKQTGVLKTTITNYSTTATSRDNRTSKLVFGSRSIRVGNPGLQEMVDITKRPTR